MENSNLKIYDNKIIIFDGITTKSISADEIYSAVIEKNYNGVLSKENCLFLESLISFSNYPANIYIALEVISSPKSVMAFIEGKTPCGKIFRINSHNNRPEDHIIVDKIWYPLLSDSLTEISTIFKNIDFENGSPLTLKQYIDLKSICSNSDIQLITKLDSLPIEADYFFSKDLFDIENIGLKANLYDYQKTGWRWLSSLCNEGIGGILGDEMGLGKTLQIIALLASEIKGKQEQALIICPSTLLENWRREIEKFFPDLITYIHQGQKRTGNIKSFKGIDIIISSYETVVRDTSLFSQIIWRLIILDEAQAIKNPNTNRSIWIKQLPRHTAFAVTGTPVENRLSDLWSIMDFVMPGYLGDQKSFREKYEDSIDGASRLEPVVSPFILRRKVLDVAKDLPERIDIPQWLVMSNEEANNYETLREEVICQMGGNATLPVLTKLRMFCAHPKLVHEEEDILMSSTKYRRLIEILEEIFENNSKVIVFCSYQRMADLITVDIKERFKVYTNFIDGRTPINLRQNIVDDFSKHDGSALLSLNPKAAGAGLNITAANHVIHYNLEWNPATEDQASARAYRRGQNLPVTVHRLIYSKTVEEGINDRLQRKRGLAENAVVGVNGNTDLQDIAHCLNLNPTGLNDKI